MSDKSLNDSIQISRRQFLALAAVLGASSAWASRSPQHSRLACQERRDLYPEGVASADPDAHSVLLWTRRPFCGESSAHLIVEVSEDEAFTRVIATSKAAVSAISDWTCRVVAGNLKPSRVYWYRFIDPDGHGSRVGRTITAPVDNDTRPVKFAFVSCQNANMGAQHAYRRMIYEDERAPESEQLGFVLHLGDFIYEVVWYPQDRPQGFNTRRLRDIVRYPQGEKIADFHVPATLDDYRAIYRAYLHDSDLQDARARWPFVCIWDNHEFSIHGWQSVQMFNGQNRPAQTRKVAANQAWFEYQPARIVKSGGPRLDQFNPPAVHDAPIERFDQHGLGEESNNRAALTSLTGYRALRWGRHVELILTDQRSYRTEEFTALAAMNALASDEFPTLFPQEILEILDAGRAYAGGNAPASIRCGERVIPNFRQHDPPQTFLGALQKRWFLERLKSSQATWKIWANTIGTLDGRVDPQNLPSGLTKPWAGSGYAICQVGDYATAYRERAEIYAAVRDEKISGFATICGNSHSFWAGLAAPSLPPQPFEPVGVAFVTGSISAPGDIESMETHLPQDHPLRVLYLLDKSMGTRPEPTFNMLLRHGVRSCLEYARTGDLERARSLSNPQLAPHLSFLDLDGHGYATVHASGNALECEFVCIPRPLEEVAAPDGGPLLYRVVHRAPLWRSGERPRLEQRVVEGSPRLSI